MLLGSLNSRSPRPHSSAVRPMVVYSGAKAHAHAARPPLIHRLLAVGRGVFLARASRPVSARCGAAAVEGACPGQLQSPTPRRWRVRPVTALPNRVHSARGPRADATRGQRRGLLFTTRTAQGGQRRLGHAQGGQVLVWSQGSHVSRPRSGRDSGTAVLDRLAGDEFTMIAEVSTAGSRGSPQGRSPLGASAGRPAV